MIVTTIPASAITSLRAEWEDLFAKSGSVTPFLSWHWLESWADFHQGRAPGELLICREGEVLTAAIPLMRRGRSAHFFADAAFADFMGLLSLPGRLDAIEAMARAIHADRSIGKLNLQGVHGLDTGSKYLVERLRELGGWATVEGLHSPNPAVELRGNFETFRAQLPKRLKQELRTAVNKLNGMGEWRFAVATGGNEVHAWYQALVEMHLCRQVGKPGRSVFSDPSAVAFFEKLLEHSSPAFTTHIAVILMGTRPVAASYSLISAGRFFYWIPTFNESVGIASLGKLLISRLIEECFSRQLSAFDFMGGDEAYKLQWSNVSYDNHNMVAFRSGLAARAYRVRRSIRGYLKRLKEKSGVLKRTWLMASKIR